MIKKLLYLLMLSLSFTQLTTAQIYFSEDFSSGTMDNWTLTDSDGDSDNWSIANLEAVQGNHATSASWSSTTGLALTPDNWMVSTAIDLTSATGNVFLQWKAYGQDQSWANENYTVYVATASDITTLGASTTSFNEVIGATNGVYANRNLDITSFVGQTIYVAFRHHAVTDQFRLNIDDIYVKTVSDNDAELASINLDRYGLVSTDYPLEIEVNNVGGNTITTLDIEWTDGTYTNSATINTFITGGASTTITHPDVINYSSVVEKEITVTITGVNGGADSYPLNNSNSKDFNTMTQSGNKAIFIEEATGTWCGWCPRGAVGMDYITQTYPNTVVGVAVHNEDPMTVTEYDNAIGLYIAGYPSSLVDRKLIDVDPAQASLVEAYNTQITEVVPVDLSSEAILTGSEYTITANANFYTNLSAADYRLAVIITEDDVTGITSGYNQTNYYSGGSNGAMGGYESLAGSVPAALMEYNHVGRALLGGFDGQANSVPTTITAGELVSYDFTYTVPATSTVENMHIVVVLIDSTDDSIVNAQQSTFAQALSVQEVSGIDSIKIYPNPATDKLNIAFQSGNGDYNVTVTDMLGRTVINNNYEGLFGSQNIELPVSELKAGHYIMNINNGSASYSAKFIISK
ncbi:T9SS type A sorting domain-containing protein [Winogradskyella undariae]|uniref:T9SS type A sorting domain-containing protein n=1 Tax=Winogradskyella undariae TaxID=1285465 RepID=UPI0015CCA016|nr:Omp28-related outer membrane protein [Winogradskyella undariae]